MRRLLLTIMITVLGLTGFRCLQNTQTLAPTPPTFGAAVLKIAAQPNSPFQKIAKRATLTISANDMFTISKTLTITDSSVQGMVPGVPSGKSRLFVVAIYDSLDTLNYRGSATTDVAAEETVSVAISVYRITSVANINGTIIEDSTTYAIGQQYEGGVIFYVDSTGHHGLISSTVDQTVNFQYGGCSWGCTGTLVSGTSAAIGSGQANTTAIVAACGSAGVYAARLCDTLTLNGYSDWYLPSLGELNLMCIHTTLIGGGLDGSTHWSSTQYDANYAWYQTGSLQDHYQNKSYPLCVRAVRSF